MVFLRVCLSLLVRAGIHYVFIWSDHVLRYAVDLTSENSFTAVHTLIVHNKTYSWQHGPQHEGMSEECLHHALYHTVQPHASEVQLGVQWADSFNNGLVHSTVSN